MVNFLALLINVIDVKYYSFMLERMSGEIFGQSMLRAENISLYPHMLVGY
jgi:hypothetical protein